MLQIYKQNRALLESLVASYTLNHQGQAETTPEEQLSLREATLQALEQQAEITAAMETDIKTLISNAFSLSDENGKIGNGDGKISIEEVERVKQVNPTAGEHLDKLLAALDAFEDGATTIEVNALDAKLAVYGATAVATDVVRADVEAASEINLSSFTRTMYRGMDRGDYNIQLQKLLKATGHLDESTRGSTNFGPKTETAVKAFQAANGMTQDGIVGNGTLKALVEAAEVEGDIPTIARLTAADRAIINGGSTETAQRRAEVRGTLERQTEITSASIDRMIEFIEATSGRRDVNTIYRAITRERNFDNQGFHILNIVQRAFGQDGRMKARNRAAEIYNIINADRAARGKFDRAYEALLGNQYQDNGDEDGLNSQGQSFLRKAKKALPWIAGVYVADIPLPFMRKMVPSGVPLDRAFAFTEWVKNGMQGEFNPRETVDTGADALHHLKGLRNTLAMATSYIEANANRNNLAQVTVKVRQLISTYIVHRFGPDADILRSSTQGLFENLFDGLGAKGPIARMIEKIITDSKSGRVNFDDIFELQKMLIEEDNDGLFGLGNGANSAFIDAFSNRNAYMSGVQRQGDVIDAYVRAIAEGRQSFEAVQTQERSFASIPDTNAEYQRGRVAPGAYGPSVPTNASGADMLAALRSTRPSPNHNRDSIGWIMYGLRNLDTDMDARKIPYEAIATAIGNGRMVPLSEYKDAASIVNTGINGEIVSRDLDSLEARGDTHMFHAPIEYQVDGQTLKYNLYLRPDCSNFVMIPDQWDNNVGVGVNGRLPVIIPWNILISGGGTNPEVIDDVVTDPIIDTPIDIIDLPVNPGVPIPLSL